MYSILIPAFLIAQIGVENEWKRGSEITFQVHINRTGNMMEQSNQIIGIHLLLKLRCQGKSEETLRCQFDNDDTEIIVTDKNGKPSEEMSKEGWEDPREYDTITDPFEVVFDSDGIEGLIVEETIRPSDLDIIRSIVNQLNVGLDLREKKDGVYHAVEGSIVGECDTVFKVYRKNTVQNSMRRARNYKIELYEPFDDKGRSKSELRVEKVRDLNKCSYKSNYFFGSREAHRVEPNANVIASLLSSMSRISVSETEFASETCNKFLISNESGSSRLVLEETVRITLESIESVEREIPAIRNPASAGILGQKWLLGNSLEESEESEES